MCIERRISQTMASEWQTVLVVSHKMPWRALLTAVKNYNKSLEKLQDFFFKTETKTKCSRPRLHDARPGLSFLSSRRLATKTLVSRTTSLPCTTYLHLLCYSRPTINASNYFQTNTTITIRLLHYSRIAVLFCDLFSVPDINLLSPLTRRLCLRQSLLCLFLSRVTSHSAYSESDLGVATWPQAPPGHRFKQTLTFSVTLTWFSNIHTSVRIPANRSQWHQY